MSNTLKIKHGSSPPQTENLESYELGYSRSNKGLYLKDEEEIIHLNDTSKIEEDITEINTKLENVSGIVVGDTAPENTGALWIDTTIIEGEEGNGIAKYYNEESGEWLPIAATWG